MLSRMAPAFERFPHDIFKEIMLHTYIYDLELREFDIKVLSPPIPASHVCRSWRRALLSDSTMWTCILFPEMSPKWIMELLRRSDSSLLNVFLAINRYTTYGTSHDEASNTLSALFHQIHRFRILRVYIHVWDRHPTSPPGYIEVLTQRVLSHLERPAPKLRTLSFWYEYLDDDPDYSPDYTFIKRLFSGDAPILKRIHHQLSPDVQELDCTVFHGLSELHLTLSLSSSFDFNRFLDLLALSPCLRLLRLDVDSSNERWPDSEQPSDRRKVALSFLEKLRLDVNFTVELTGFVLRHIVFPSNVVWHIVSRLVADFEEPPSVSQFLTRAHFTSLHVNAFFSVAELTFQETLNENHINRYVYTYEGIQDFPEDAWDIVKHALKFSSRITHTDFEVGDLSDFDHIFQAFFSSMSSLKSLVIRPDISLWVSNADEIRLVCFAALGSSPQWLEGILDNNNTNMAIENLKLYLIPPGLENITPHDSKPSTSTISVFPCPLLREVTVELHDPLKTQHAKVLCACSDLRQNAGYPFQIHVRCPEIEQGVEEILGRRKDDTIKISSPFYVKKEYIHPAFSPYGFVSGPSAQ